MSRTQEETGPQDRHTEGQQAPEQRCPKSPSTRGVDTNTTIRCTCQRSRGKNRDNTQCWWGPRETRSLTQGAVTAVAGRGPLAAGSRQPQCGPGTAVLGMRPSKTNAARGRSHLQAVLQQVTDGPQAGLRPPALHSVGTGTGRGPCSDLLRAQRTVLRRPRPPRDGCTYVIFRREDTGMDTRGTGCWGEAGGNGTGRTGAGQRAWQPEHSLCGLSCVPPKSVLEALVPGVATFGDGPQMRAQGGPQPSRTGVAPAPSVHTERPCGGTEGGQPSPKPAWGHLLLVGCLGSPAHTFSYGGQS